MWPSTCSDCLGPFESNANSRTQSSQRERRVRRDSSCNSAYSARPPRSLRSAFEFEMKARPLDNILDRGDRVRRATARPSEPTVRIRDSDLEPQKGSNCRAGLTPKRGSICLPPVVPTRGSNCDRPASPKRPAAARPCWPSQSARNHSLSCPPHRRRQRPNAQDHRARATAHGIYRTISRRGLRCIR